METGIRFSFSEQEPAGYRWLLFSCGYGQTKKNWVLWFKEGALSQIQTEVDPVRKEYYGFTDKIRELEESGLSWGLPLKK